MCELVNKSTGNSQKKEGIPTFHFPADNSQLTTHHSQLIVQDHFNPISPTILSIFSSSIFSVASKSAALASAAFTLK